MEGFDFFPTDVRIRVQGDHGAAMNMSGAGRQLLMKAMLVQKGSSAPVQMLAKSDAGEVSVLLFEGQKIVTFFPAPPEPPGPPNPSGIYLLCGMVRGGTVHVDPDTHKRYLREFRPTLATATSHKIPDAWEDNERLCPPSLSDGAITQHQTVKASMFSGAMKRVAQAVYGLGWIRDGSYYLTRPAKAHRYMSMDYSYTSTKTHGIYKSGVRNHWLVEISSANGVLAMPLPLIASTMGKGYRSYLKSIGDTGGLEVAEEFGGLPTGESFPTGAALTTAIADGRVLRLISAENMGPFYDRATDTEFAYPWSSHSGWAFSDFGFLARNTLHYQREYVVGTGSTSRVRSIHRSEHWQVSIALNAHNIAAKYPDPVGTGSATLEMLHSGRIFNGDYLAVGDTDDNKYATCILPGAFNLWDATSNNDYDRIERIEGGCGGELPQTVYEPDYPFGAVVWTFFDGNLPKYMKWVGREGVSNDTTYDTSYGGSFAIAHSATISPAAFVLGGDIDLRQMDYFNSTGYVYPPVHCDDLVNFPAELVPLTYNSSMQWSWAFIPRFCREGVVIGASLDAQSIAYNTEGWDPCDHIPFDWSISHGADYSARAYFGGVGVVEIEMINGTISSANRFTGNSGFYYPPHAGEWWGFGSVIGYGSITPYARTRYEQRNQTPSHAYIHTLTLNGANANPIHQLNFIGSMT